MQSTAWIVSAAVLAVVLLLFLVIRVKVQAFIALLLVSIAFGLATGTNPVRLVDLIVEEMGGSLGQVAIVIGLGAVFGEILKRAGAAERLASQLIGRFSDRNVAWGLGFAGFLISIAVFIDVAIVILVPMLYVIARRTKKSLLYYGIPLCAGLSVTHTFIPPTPGPIATAGIMHADLGLVILFGAICGTMAMVVGGPVFGKFIAKRIYVAAPEEERSSVTTGPGTGTGSAGAAGDEQELAQDGSPLPSFRAVLGALLLPLVLILGGTTGDALLIEGSAPQIAFAFIGHPVIALLVTCLYTLWFFGVRRGANRAELQELATRALAPAGVIILITGAGGVFGGLLVETGIGEVMADAMTAWGMPIVVFGFLAAAIIRISQGSGTVAMITGATLTAPLAEQMNLSDPMVALTCIAIACGGTAFSHVNDSGFWMANRYFGMSVADTLKSWTVMKSLVGITGFVCALILSAFFS
ncbi:Gnt-I system low-affinity gluconate transporter [Tamaricihabitans halophyticus]|uniref:Gnt-I system low-affinity gluconate transporter n=1 Tax=Tamaricihabitans halophyticus TaxID=1262583 RepID=A0A4V2SSX1_9PSEU|nr:gluconate:H+ symporter [Tamaricihabitans halophyticus]TCP48506.1 Gnt-I system low-affinity gluconate transporter [Tamaricihabitans halophyticus]